MYAHTLAKIRLNKNNYTDSFETFIGTKQGDNNSPLLLLYSASGEQNLA